MYYQSQAGFMTDPHQAFILFMKLDLNDQFEAPRDLPEDLLDLIDEMAAQD